MLSTLRSRGSLRQKPSTRLWRALLSRLKPTEGKLAQSIVSQMRKPGHALLTIPTPLLARVWATIESSDLIQGWGTTSRTKIEQQALSDAYLRGDQPRLRLLLSFGIQPGRDLICTGRLRLPSVTADLIRAKPALLIDLTDEQLEQLLSGQDGVVAWMILRSPKWKGLGHNPIRWLGPDGEILYPSARTGAEQGRLRLEQELGPRLAGYVAKAL